VRSTGELGDQAGLADSGIAGQEDQPFGAAGLDRVGFDPAGDARIGPDELPVAIELLQFAGPPDQRGGPAGDEFGRERDREPVAVGSTITARAGLPPVRMQEPFVSGDGLRRRGGTELIAQQSA
jgi:hypothetical protein